MVKVPVPQQLLDDVKEKPKVIIRVPKLNRAQRRKAINEARRTIKRLGTMPKSRAGILTPDVREFYDRMHMEKLEVEYSEVE